MLVIWVCRVNPDCNEGKLKYLPNNIVDLRLKTHVQHSVCLIQHQICHTLQREEMRRDHDRCQMMTYFASEAMRWYIFGPSIKGTASSGIAK